MGSGASETHSFTSHLLLLLHYQPPFLLFPFLTSPPPFFGSTFFTPSFISFFLPSPSLLVSFSSLFDLFSSFSFYRSFQATLVPYPLINFHHFIPFPCHPHSLFLPSFSENCSVLLLRFISSTVNSSSASFHFILLVFNLHSSPLALFLSPSFWPLSCSIVLFFFISFLLLLCAFAFHP